MMMTIQEIVKSYKEAADKGKQVGVLADLNDCSKEQIIVVLKGQGITDIPLNGAKRGRKPTGNSPKSPIIKKQTRVVDTRSNQLILEGIDAIDGEIQPLQQKLNALYQKRLLLQQALEVEVYYEE